jgi:hypothetical protein
MKSARAGCDILKRLSRLRLMVPEHCTKEVGIALLMADHFLRPAARFLIDAMRAVEMPAPSEYPHHVPARMA